MKNIVIENTELTSSLLSEQTEFANIYATGPEWLKVLRLRGAEAFRSLGIPPLKDEEWKYAPISRKLDSEYSFTKGQQQCEFDDPDIMALHSDSKYRVFLKNGGFCEELSRGMGSHNGIHIHAGIPDERSEQIRSLLEGNDDLDTDNFLALNTSFIKDLIFIQIDRDTVIDEPVEIIHILGSGTGNVMSFPRVLIHAEEGASASVTESYITPGNSNKGFHASVTEIVEEKNSRVEHVCFQDVDEQTTLISQKYVRQQRDSRSGSFTLTLNGGFVRNNLKVSLHDINAHAELHGVYIPNGEQLIDNHTLVDHLSAHCYSNELYKGVMGDRSQAVFNGKVFVRRDAQKTNAYQSNNNILLTDDAQINTKPQLEIFADDVKCSHGATTGQLDEDALFYLRSRGIGEAEARTLLVTAFMAEVLDEIEDEALRETFSQKVEEKLLRMSEQR